ncbi:MAG: glycosyltransferase family 4 protein [Caulobacteraceae bacterium]|nr:glycosyltransferase family 4 protein [Caulobacteraceae bacterium]
MATLAAELELERREHHAARQELNRLRRKVVEHAQASERARDTVSFRLGAALLRARTIRGFFSLPFEILALVRESLRRRREGRRIAALSAHTNDLIDDSLDDAGRALQGVRRMGLPGHDASVVLMGLASARAAYDAPGAARLAKEAVAMDPSPRQMGRAAQILFLAGEAHAPAQYARAALQGRWLFSRRDAAKLRVIEAFAGSREIVVPARRPEASFSAQPRRALFVASSSLPHHTSGYTLRTQNIAQAISRTGWDLQLVSRPGYPWDRADARAARVLAGTHQEGGVDYTRLRGPSAGETPFPNYVEEAARVLERHVAKIRPSLIYAASNYVTGLPALIAARRAGVPFVYSVRGLWEYTAAAKNPGWETTERFALQRDLETRVAMEADRVIVLSEGLRREMIARGVSPDRIRLAPNCVDPAAFKPVARDQALARRLGLGDRYVLGFLGSLEHYEGLDDLLEAVAMLVREGLNLAVLIVGEGSASGHLREEARRHELGDRVVQLGRIAPDQVAEHYSVVDVAVFPRLPLPVCEIVAPLKPLEAMAMAKPVIGSDVGGIAEIIRPGKTGLLFSKGDVQSLAAAIRRLQGDPGLALALGRQARAWVEAERTWDTAAEAIVEVCASLTERSET